jgi:hypothetical protein
VLAREVRVAPSVGGRGQLLQNVLEQTIQLFKSKVTLALQQLAIQTIKLASAQDFGKGDALPVKVEGIELSIALDKL